jgi:predicted ATPase
MGYAADDFGYLVDLGLPQMAGIQSAFTRDPEIKRESVFVGPAPRPNSTLVRRGGPLAETRSESGRGFDQLTRGLPTYHSVLAEFAHPGALPELSAVRDRLRSWRFYDSFRVDAAAPARHPQVGTRTPVLADDGSDLAAAIQTIIESGSGSNSDELCATVAEAFNGASVSITDAGGLFDLAVQQPGMLRPLRSAELSDGTLRFLLWAAALLSPRPPSLMVLNEPETSLHPDLVRPLATLIRSAAKVTQVFVVTHSRALIGFLGADGDEDREDTARIELYKDCGETLIVGQTRLTAPSWDWGSR